MNTNLYVPRIKLYHFCFKMSSFSISDWILMGGHVTDLSPGDPCEKNYNIKSYTT